MGRPTTTAWSTDQVEGLAHWAIHDPVFGQVTRLFTNLTTRAVQTAALLAWTLRLCVHGLVQAYECGGLSSGPAGGVAPVPRWDHASLQGDGPVLHWPEELAGRAWDGGCEAWEDVRFATRAARVTSRPPQMRGSWCR